ncbi:DUF4232 domain-containing protein [Rhodococcus sp. NPDC003318]|uniref:DUF4232 domain-containing protein n=1 Tax=Rhodococcus sp. NPDC003318 TaxID=3364503 RepID=UPI00369BA3B5
MTAAVLTGCGTEEPHLGGAVPATPSIAAPGLSGGTAAAGTTGPAPDPCTASDLSVTDTRTDESAGSVTIPLRFVNTGERACSLHGFPGVSYVTAKDGTEVGAAATHSGDIGEPVTLAPGGRATVTVRAAQVVNYTPAQCEPTPVAGLRIYPPNDSQALYVAHAGTGCARPEVEQLQVTAVDAQ